MMTDKLNRFVHHFFKVLKAYWYHLEEVNLFGLFLGAETELGLYICIFLIEKVISGSKD